MEVNYISGGSEHVNNDILFYNTNGILAIMHHLFLTQLSQPHESWTEKYFVHIRHNFSLATTLTKSVLESPMLFLIIALLSVI